MNIAFLTTIFPMQEKFLIDFFNSLKNQTYKEFDIVVVNDGYKNFGKIKQKFSELRIIELPFSSTLAKNREYGINYCIEKKYDVLIFGDSDDYFVPNRVEKVLEKLEHYNVVVNDLTLFDENGVLCEKYFSHRLKNNFVFDYEFIKNKNICGLSNTAINLKILRNINIPDNIIGVDWFLYKQLLKHNQAIFTNETITFYRQYENNTVGLKNDGKFKFWWEN